MCLLKKHSTIFILVTYKKKIKFILKVSLEGKPFNINLTLWNCEMCLLKIHF